jgi:hypothetical protein
MASIVVTIDLDFIADFAGDHRVCWRIQGSGTPYDCSTIVTCAGGGAPCTTSFTATVNDTSCDGDVDFEGYIQATCENLASLAGRLPWTVSFTPVPVCERYEMTVNDATVTDVTIKDPGYLYIPADTLTWSRNPLDLYPSIPANTATGDVLGGYGVDLGDGIINSITSLINPGTGYAIADTIDVVQTGHVGTTCVIRVVHVGGGGIITAYTIDNPGDGYSNQTANPFSYVTSLGVGTDADFEIVSIQAAGADYQEFGAILNVNVTAAGRYSLQPTISIGTATGVDGDLSSVAYAVTNPWVTGVNDCDASAITVTDLTLADEPFAICSAITPVPPADYDIIQIGCCIAADSTSTVCTTHTVENPTAAPIDCEVTICGGETTVETIAALTTEAFCVIEDGINTRNTKLIVTDLAIACS